jgi:hypothetical protein
VSSRPPDNFGVDTEFNRFLGRLVNLVAFQTHLKPAIFSSTEEGLARSERARPRLILRVFSLKISLLPSVSLSIEDDWPFIRY